MKRPALMMIAALSLWPHAALADGDVASRHLRYVAVARVDGVPTPVTIDLTIGLTQAQGVARVDIDEHARDEEFGHEDVAIDREGTVSGADAGLTFEEETLLDLIALQFENMTGVDPGDHWDRTGDLRLGSHETHFLVRGRADGGIVDLVIARTMEFPDGSRGAWHGNVSYDSAAVVPRSIAITGEVVDKNSDARRPLQLSARLVGDSFQPPR